jgi:hypothetical protein
VTRPTHQQLVGECDGAGGSPKAHRTGTILSVPGVDLSENTTGGNLCLARSIIYVVLIFSVGATLSLVQTQAAGSDSKAKDQVRQVERDWLAADAKGDASLLHRIISTISSAAASTAGCWQHHSAGATLGEKCASSSVIPGGSRYGHLRSAYPLNRRRRLA